MSWRTLEEIKPKGEIKQAISYFKRAGSYNSIIEMIDDVEEIMDDLGIKGSERKSILDEYCEHLAKLGKNPQTRERLPLVWGWLTRNK
tara:strand:- start:53 stop:316 length:264 start_codon:yes stop_codon:yes gene_type:complete